MISKQPAIRQRNPNKLATTTYVNEVAAAVNGMGQRPTFGQPDVIGAILLIVLIKIIGNRTGGGKYSAQIVRKPVTAVSYTGNLTASDIADTTTAIDCTAINPHEESQSTHSLTASTVTCHYYAGELTGQVDEAGLPVVRIIGGIDLEGC